MGAGYCRLQMPLRLALGVRETVVVHRPGALDSPPSNASLTVTLQGTYSCTFAVRTGTPERGGLGTHAHALVLYFGCLQLPCQVRYVALVGSRAPSALACRICDGLLALVLVPSAVVSFDLAGLSVGPVSCCGVLCVATAILFVPEASGWLPEAPQLVPITCRWLRGGGCCGGRKRGGLQLDYGVPSKSVLVAVVAVI